MKDRSSSIDLEIAQHGYKFESIKDYKHSTIKIRKSPNETIYCTPIQSLNKLQFASGSENLKYCTNGPVSMMGQGNPFVTISAICEPIEM